jgi:NAD(P)-dependent dehydrogenase (short-subunit alcohol dehydrogenase family)
VRDRGAIDAAVAEGVEAFGHLDIVIANAGIWASSPFNELPEQTWRDGIDVMLHGPYNTCRATIPHILEGGNGGSIVIISSSASFLGFPGQVQYNVAKNGLVGLMRTLANEFAPQSIRVNSIHPCTVRTNMIDHPFIHKVFSPDIENPTIEDSRIPFTGMNLLPIPWIEPIDVSNAIAWLVSDEARYVTGVTLPIDAGSTMKA